MPKAHISEDNLYGCYFLNLTIRKWYYIFDRYNRWDVLADCLRFYQQNKGLEIFAYVFMLNHLHLIVRAKNVSGFVRDFKKYTSRELKQNLKDYEPNVLELFVSETGEYHFWQDDNAPRLIETEAFYIQKMNYIHENPVRKGYVEQAEHWKWSSANPASTIKIDNMG